MSGSPTPRSGSIWFTGRALLLHLTVAIVVPTCLLAAYWQFLRAVGGNSSSYAYMVEWPAFALLAIWAWWALVHLPSRGGTADGAPVASSPAAAPRGFPADRAGRTQLLLDRRRVEPTWSLHMEGPRLQAYNRYLAQLDGVSPKQARRLPRSRRGDNA